MTGRYNGRVLADMKNGKNNDAVWLIANIYTIAQSFHDDGVDTAVNNVEMLGGAAARATHRSMSPMHASGSFVLFITCQIYGLSPSCSMPSMSAAVMRAAMSVPSNRLSARSRLCLCSSTMPSSIVCWATSR